MMTECMGYFAMGYFAVCPQFWGLHQTMVPTKACGTCVLEVVAFLVKLLAPSILTQEFKCIASAFVLVFGTPSCAVAQGDRFPAGEKHRAENFCLPEPAQMPLCALLGKNTTNVKNAKKFSAESAGKNLSFGGSRMPGRSGTPAGRGVHPLRPGEGTPPHLYPALLLSNPVEKRLVGSCQWENL